MQFLCLFRYEDQPGISLDKNFQVQIQINSDAIMQAVNNNNI